MSQETYLPWWQRWLLQAVRMSREDTMPQHMAFIMDGNRRFAKKLERDSVDGHKEGVRSLCRLCESCVLLGIKYVTVYGFALGNFHRSPEEVRGLFELAEQTFSNREWIKYAGTNLSFFIKNRIRLRLLGDLSYLPVSLRDTLHRAVAETEAACRRPSPPTTDSTVEGQRSLRPPLTAASAETSAARSPDIAKILSATTTTMRGPSKKTPTHSCTETRDLKAAIASRGTASPFDSQDGCRLLLTVCLAYGSRSEIARSLAGPSATTSCRAGSGSISDRRAATTTSASPGIPTAEPTGSHVGATRTTTASFDREYSCAFANAACTNSSDAPPAPAIASTRTFPCSSNPCACTEASPSSVATTATATAPRAAAPPDAAVRIIVCSTQNIMEDKARPDSAAYPPFGSPLTTGAVAAADRAAPPFSAEERISNAVLGAAGGDCWGSHSFGKPPIPAPSADSFDCAASQASHESIAFLSSAACDVPFAAAAASPDSPLQSESSGAAEPGSSAAVINVAARAVLMPNTKGARLMTGPRIRRKRYHSSRRGISTFESIPVSSLEETCEEFSAPECVLECTYSKKRSSSNQRRDVVQKQASRQSEPHDVETGPASGNLCYCCITRRNGYSCEAQQNSSSATAFTPPPTWCACYSESLFPYNSAYHRRDTFPSVRCHCNNCDALGCHRRPDRRHCGFQMSPRSYHFDKSSCCSHNCCCFGTRRDDARCSDVQTSSSCRRVITAPSPRAAPCPRYHCEELLRRLLEGKDLNVSACGQNYQGSGKPPAFVFFATGRGGCRNMLFRNLEQLFWQRLQHGDVPPPDLLVRTSGERRLSDFLLYETSQQTHFHFLPVLWPELSPLHVLMTVLHYQIYQMWLAPICRLAAKATNLFQRNSYPSPLDLK